MGYLFCNSDILWGNLWSLIGPWIQFPLQNFVQWSQSPCRNISMDGACCLLIVCIHWFFTRLTSFYRNPHLKKQSDSQKCYITKWQVYIHISMLLLVMPDPKCLLIWIYVILLPAFDSIYYKLKCTSSWQILIYLKASMQSFITSSPVRLNITTPFNSASSDILWNLPPWFYISF